MAARDNIHSHVVFWLKVILPLAALAILATLFLFPRNVDTARVVPASESDIADTAPGQRLTAPEYSGLTSDGASITIRASKARPGGDSGIAEAENLDVIYRTPAGLEINVTGKTGRMDEPAGRVLLSGNVHIKTSNGFSMVTEGLDAALDQTELHSTGRVEGEAPFGTLDAGAMEIRLKVAEPAAYELVFNKGVKLIYQRSEGDPG